MIKIQDWIIKPANDISIEKRYDVAITHAETYDDRDSWSEKFIQKTSDKISKIKYHPNEVSLEIDNKLIAIKDISTHKIQEERILIDATSLSLPEIIHIFEIMNNDSKSFDIIYVQPSNYKKKESKDIDKSMSFDLSDDGIGIQQLPPYIGYTENSEMFISIGFEGHRIGALINTDEYKKDNAICLIGVPAFKLGWEIKSLSNNHKQLVDLKKNLSCRFRFSGANDPLKTYELIDNVYSSLKYEKRNLCLAPFGTKPSTIAAALFAVNNKGVIVTYDFVQKKPKRSDGTDLVHIWTCQHS